MVLEKGPTVAPRVFKSPRGEWRTVERDAPGNSGHDSCCQGVTQVGGRHGGRVIMKLLPFTNHH